METPVFSPAAAAAFDLNTLPPGAYHVPGFGTVDLCSISLKEARRLFDYGFPYLSKKAAPAVPPVPATKKVQPANQYPETPTDVENALYGRRT